jgi:hypothetical protein
MRIPKWMSAVCLFTNLITAQSFEAIGQEPKPHAFKTGVPQGRFGEPEAESKRYSERMAKIKLAADVARDALGEMPKGRVLSAVKVNAISLDDAALVLSRSFRDVTVVAVPKLSCLVIECDRETSRK